MKLLRVCIQDVDVRGFFCLRTADGSVLAMNIPSRVWADELATRWNAFEVKADASPTCNCPSCSRPCTPPATVPEHVEGMKPKEQGT
jgi:hypothetical protein